MEEMDDGHLSGFCRFRVAGNGNASRVALFHALAREDMPIIELTEARMTLEQAFLQVTTGIDR
jgi:hypothetical protein